MLSSKIPGMKKYFITGLVILLPLALTLAIVIFIFNLLTGPFLGVVKTIFDHYHLFEKGFLFLSADQIQTLFAQILIIASLFSIVIGLGFIARWFFFHTLIRFAEYIVKRIPLVRTIYKTCQEVIRTIFTSKTKSFKTSGPGSFSKSRHLCHRTHHPRRSPKFSGRSTDCGGFRPDDSQSRLQVF